MIDDKEIFDYLKTKDLAPKEKVIRGGFIVNRLQRIPYVKELIGCCLQPLVEDPRNDIFVLYTLLMLSLPISGYWLFCSFSWIRAILHVVLVLEFLTQFTSMLHNACHRRLYKTSYFYFEPIIHYFLNPFMGQTWNTYYYHHIKHHHVTGNGPDDLSSTETYERDNYIHFLIYFFRFVLFTLVELPIYFINRSQYYYAFSMVSGECSCYLIYSYLWSYNPLAITFVFLVPRGIILFGMMSGNFVQHAFVDPRDSENSFKNSITCIDCHYNTLSFNDGYHSSHHINPLRHWSEHSKFFIDNVPHIKTIGGGIVFKNIDYLGIWWLLMTRNYVKLATHFVDLTGEKSNEEIISYLKLLVTPTNSAPSAIVPAEGAVREVLSDSPTL